MFLEILFAEMRNCGNAEIIQLAEMRNCGNAEIIQFAEMRNCGNAEILEFAEAEFPQICGICGCNFKRFFRIICEDDSVCQEISIISLLA